MLTPNELAVPSGFRREKGDQISQPTQSGRLVRGKADVPDLSCLWLLR